MITKIFKDEKEFKNYLIKTDDDINGCTQEFLDKHKIKIEQYSRMNKNNFRCFNCWHCRNCWNCIDCNNCYWCEDCKNCNNCVGINNSNEADNEENNKKEILLSNSYYYNFKFVHIESCTFLNKPITISKAGKKGEWVECLINILQELKKIDPSIIKKSCKDNIVDSFLLTEIGKENTIKDANYCDSYMEPLDDNIYLCTTATNTDKKMKDLRDLFDKYKRIHPEIIRETLSFNLLLNDVKKWNNNDNNKEYDDEN